VNVFSGMWTIASIDLRQRLRGLAWYVLLGVFFVIVLAVTIVATIALSYESDPGDALYSTIVYFVLLLASLTAPALSGNAINGDREAGTLATTQVTLVSSTQLVIGKWLAAWLSSLAYLVAAVPFLVWCFILSGVHPATAAVSLLILIVLLGVVSAVGVGLSGLMRRPLFSIVATYLVVALLSVGTLIAFGLGSLAFRSTVTVTSHAVDWSQITGEVTYDPKTGAPIGVECTLTDTYVYDTPRADYVWWILAANPYVVIADAQPTQFDVTGNPTDLFGWTKTAVRQVQIPPELEQSWSECEPSSWQSPTPEEIIATTTPSWFVGLAIHVALGALLLIGAVSATRTPAVRLPAGSRIA